MSETETVLMQPPDGGPPREIEATPEALVPLMVRGWTQVLATTAPTEDAEAIEGAII